MRRVREGASYSHPDDRPRKTAPMGSDAALLYLSSLSRPSTTGAGFNGRVNGFTSVDSARPVADQ